MDLYRVEREESFFPLPPTLDENPRSTAPDAAANLDVTDSSSSQS